MKASQHLYQLANPTISRWDNSELDAVVEGLDGLIDELPFPAIVSSRYQDVLAANPMAQALSPGFAPGQNFLYWRLLDPAARQLYVDWDEATEVAVSGLREVAGADPRDDRMQALIAELSSTSSCFRELWARADVGYQWASSTCVIRKSGKFTYIATSFSFRICREPLGSICSSIEPNPAATPPER